MAATNNPIDCNFKLITYKKKSRKLQKIATTNIESSSPTASPQFSLQNNLRRLEEAKVEVKSSDLFQSAFASLREGLTILGNPNIIEIYCIGLGKIGECLISRFQLAFLLCLKDLYNIQVNVYDPQFTLDDVAILEHCQCNVLKENFEGKYIVKEKSTTVFYLPHCPKQLTNNLLWANWGLNLNCCVIISNSFNAIVENICRYKLSKSTEYIRSILPYTVELPIFNNFKYFEVFNDTAIHIFPWEKLQLITDYFWNCALEPNYSDDDIEFISNKKALKKL